ncbi:MAG TPA: glycogen synthase GlgA [Vicinamibacteria bacterium]|nr:glycogen synthase GlgA [Vicinamibacteria bacterium]
MLLSGAMANGLHVAFPVSESVPFVKTGGLADVAASLPKALARLGHRVTVFLPRYGSVPFPAGEFVGSVHVPVDGQTRSAGFYRRDLQEGVRVIFVEHPPFFDRPSPYGLGNADYSDNHLRFAFFSRACLEYFRSRGERPDLFHAHDWQTGLVPVYLKSFYGDDPTLNRLPTVFTIHNLAYQGNFGRDTLGVLGLPWNLAHPGALEYHGGISYLKGGVLFSELINTVSPQYAREIQSPEQGAGFDGVLRSRAQDLWGILNGVDYEEWSPEQDSHIAKRYSARDLSGKAECKADLLRTFGLPEFPDHPVVGIISRLIPQKGFDVVAEAWWDLLQRDLRMVVLGTGEPAIQDGLAALAARAPDRFAVRFRYDPVLAHKIEAGADLFLMPSRFEPCGLTQMYSLRYGTVPVVRSTGGLIDTVEPYQFATGTGTGFRFDQADGTGMMWALDQALSLFTDRPAWERLMANGMKQDFSWERSARLYQEMYRRAVTRV